MTYTPYNPQIIEPKWQKEWEKSNLYKTPVPSADHPKKYILDMFPYPSGEVLHVGHMEGYVATDVYSRYLRMKGFSVLHPMGWDAFGLPAENYAIKTGIPPEKSIHANTERFKEQLKMLGLTYDWEREVDTSTPEYYKWTQWLFTVLFKMGLAYKKKAAANWCPKDETVLANEQVENGKCERCGTEVVQKELDQWFFKITAYADRMIDDLAKINWPESTKLMQKNWIGKKEGRKIKFGEIEIFTTRPETILGATFIVLSPNHPAAGKVKTVINPATNKEIPVFVDEYVLDTVGTGAIMGVPAYDERDKKFAEKMGLTITKEEFTDKQFGEPATIYHLRDWLVSRQRYWGAPIPMVFCEKDDWQAVPLEELPVKLPTDVDFLPHGESPIARSNSFQEGAKCPVCGEKARREVDTMDTFVDSSWYFLRFLDPKNSKEFASAQSIKEWMPVDTYVGGGHTVQHLLFARFFQKVLADAGLVDKSIDEPFTQLRIPGWILGPDSRKMSKRWGNVIKPDDVVKQYGADTMRTYEMFMAPFEVDKPWNVTSVAGVRRFINRIDARAKKDMNDRFSVSDDQLVAPLNKLVTKVEKDIKNFRFNTAVAFMMEFINLWEKSSTGLNRADLEMFLRILAPFAPHITEELWHLSGNIDSIHVQSWPVVEEKGLEEEIVTIVVSINGKARGQLKISTQNKELLEKDRIIQTARDLENVSKYLVDKQLKKTIYVQNKVVNFVV